MRRRFPAALMGLTLAAATVLGGCADQNSDAFLFTPIGVHSKSDAYQAGWRAGCKSGYADKGHPGYDRSKDRGRYGEGGDYAAGWDKGYESCQTDYERKQRAGG